MMHERLGRYRLEEPLGEGGMGRVYAAELEGPAGFRKRVAVKLLTGGSVEGLVREARLGGLLRHPNLVEVYALEQDGDDWFVAMELVPGGSLAGIGPLPPRAVVEIGLQVCAGLEHAHQQIGLVHLDLKPSNLLIDGATVKIADLGIARAKGFEVDGIRGTPAYMAPEQLAGRPVDARTDVYALGVVLHELATGVRSGASRPETWSTMEFAGEDAEPVVDLRGAPWLEPVLRRCVAPDPASRFSSAAQLAAALRGLEVDGVGLARALAVDEGLSAGPRSATAPKTNLEPGEDAFIGRAESLSRLRAALDRWRVVTLKGIGGVGKTRLAKEVGLAWVHGGHGAVWFVDLSDARTALDAVGAVAAVLQVPLGTGDVAQLTAQLGQALAGRGPTWLILDNLEQVEGLGPVLRDWLEQAAGVHFLLTTRQPLRVRGEHVHELPPLAVDEARALLVSRAEARGRSVALDPALDELALRLDGLPLALELAASRLGLLSATQIVERLDQRLDLLRDRRSDAPDRQATLRGMLDWSWDLLDPHERSAVAQLGVFRGGFDLEAAEAVLELGPDAPWAMDVVEQLVDRSLLTARPTRLGPRFAMFETVRAYAEEHLGAEPSAAAARRHSAHFARFGGDDALQALDRGGWRGRALLAENLENLAVALDRSLASGDLPLAVDLLMAAWEMWHRNGPARASLEPARRVYEASRGAGGAAESKSAVLWSRVLHREGRMEEALELIRTAIATAPTPGLKLNALLSYGVVLGAGGEPAEAERAQREGVALARQLGQGKREAVLLGSLGLNAMRRGAMGEARELLEQSLALNLDHDNRRSEAVIRGHLGILAYEQGRVLDAAGQFERALGLCWEEDRGRAAVLQQNLAQADLELGRLDAARKRLRAAREVQRDVGGRRSEAIALVTLGAVELRAGDLEEASALLVEGRSLADSAGARAWVGVSEGWLGILALESGRLLEARPLLEGAIDRLQGRLRQAAGFFRAHLGRSWAEDDPERARALLDEAVGDLQRGGYIIDGIRVLTLRGRWLRQPADLDAAEQQLRPLGLPPESLLWQSLVQARRDIG